MTPSPRRALPRWWRALLAVLLFVGAVRALGAAAESMGPTLASYLAVVIHDDASALGAGWLATYLIANGSIVAGLGVTLVESAALGPARSFLLISGSRLGAATFVLLVGVLDFLRTHPRPRLRHALGLGFLAFLVTHTIYLPATALGYALFPPLYDLFQGALPTTMEIGPMRRIGMLARGLTGRIGPLPVAGLGLLLTLASLRLFDRFLAGIDEERLQERCDAWLHRGGLSFAFGLVLTAVTTSIAVSVAALVPLFNRRLLGTRRLIPYLLGAGLGTMADTLLVALLLGSESGLAVVLVLVGSAATITLAAVLRLATYASRVARAFDLVVSRPLAALAFAGLLVVLPAWLLLAG